MLPNLRRGASMKVFLSSAAFVLIYPAWCLLLPFVVLATAVQVFLEACSPVWVPAVNLRNAEMDERGR